VVDERFNGNADLNGDGDALDWVLHTYDTATRATHDLGLAVDRTFPAAVGKRLVFAVAEGQQAFTDLNGDGDTQDLVVHAYDHATGTVTNTGHAVFSTTLALVPAEDFAFIAAYESSSGSGQSADLNGDGDTFDMVACVHSFASGTTQSLGLAAGSAEVAPGRLAFGVSELAQGNTDLNGDGDQGDVVLFTHGLQPGQAWNTGVAGIPIGFAGTTLVAVADESDEGLDLNGDGDLIDFVLHRFDPLLQTGANEGLAVNTVFPNTAPLSGPWAALVGIEAAQGATDLNGDGDAQDFVLHVYDAGAAALTNLGLAVVAGGSSIGLPQFDGGLLAFWVEEDQQGGLDLNGNGSAFDDVIHVHDPFLGTTSNLGLASELAAARVDHGLAAFLVSEPSQGPTNLNGDGDLDDRWVVHAYDAESGATTNLGWAAFGARFGVGRRTVSVLVDESDQGGHDLNGDGDTGDAVFHLWDARDGSTANLGFAGSSSSTSAELTFFTRRVAAILVSEGDQGMTDLNADGDALDTVPVIVRLGL
jgi:hypothetical protein